MRPVPPPTSAIGVCPARCSRARFITVISDPDVQAGGCRIEADVGRDRLTLEDRGQPLGHVLQHPAPRQLVDQVHRRHYAAHARDFAVGAHSHVETSHADFGPCTSDARFAPHFARRTWTYTVPNAPHPA